MVAPSSTSQSVAAGGSPSAKTFGAFTDADGLIASYQSVIEQVAGTVSESGTGLGPYTYSGATDGEAFVHMLLAKDSGGNVLATAVHGVSVGQVAGWQVIGAWDLTDANFAALTLTKGAAAVQLMRADGVTPSGLSLRYTDRTAAGTSSAAFVVGTGLTWSIAGTTRAIALAVLFDGVTMDGDDVYAVDLLYEATLPSTGDCAGWGAGPSHLATAAGWTGAYYYRAGASSYVWLPIRGTGSNITAGATTGTLTGPTATVAHTTVIHGGRVQYDYTAQQAALFGATAIPTGAGVAKHLPGLVSTTATGTTSNLYGSAVWATSDLFSAGASATTGAVKGIRLRKVNTP